MNNKHLIWYNIIWRTQATFKAVVFTKLTTINPLKLPLVILSQSFLLCLTSEAIRNSCPKPHSHNQIYQS